MTGQLLRSAAMWHCAGNFSHIIAERKNDDHTLVTGGVYQISRHPSYLGWFWWSVGTQVFLGNPLCVCAYAYASWKFFDSRIRYEERRLFTFFGDTYADFHDKVGIHIPFIKTKNLLRPDRPLN